MRDNHANVGQPDRRTISLSEDSEVEYWTRELGDFLLASVEIAPRLLCERREAEPRMLRIDGRLSGGGVPDSDIGDRRRVRAHSTVTGGEEILQPPRELGRNFAAGKMREVDRLEFVWNPRGSAVRFIDESAESTSY